MKLKTLYVRFYRSFNYDYLRKTHPKAEPHPWDFVDGNLFFPFVRVPLEHGITTIVGANESGKSQLLSAIKCLLTGDDIEPRDFCRYSQFFTVGERMFLPEFGGEFDNLDAGQADVVRELANLADESEVESFYLFRTSRGITMYVELDPEEPKDAEGIESRWGTITLSMADVERLRLPTYFTIDAKTPLPDSVPILYLGSPSEKTKNVRPRKNVFGWIENLLENQEWFRGLDPGNWTRDL